MARLFGTDGIRGVVGEDLKIEVAFNLGRALGSRIPRNKAHATFAIGRDSRISSSMLEAAATAGLCSAGVNVVSLGVIPTPAISFAILEEKLQGGVMISASHNTFEYNGIKVFEESGFKISQEEEKELEKLISSQRFLTESGARIGEVYLDHLTRAKYFKSLKSILDDVFKDQNNVPKIAIDCANGSASETANYIFETTKNIQFKILNSKPDGVNINHNCGSTNLASLKLFVLENNFDLGIAFDGDADRCLLVSKSGKEISGDNITLILARFLAKEGSLNNDVIVATNMSNCGFELAAKKQGFNVIISEVGDKNVAKKMQESGGRLGGETSGHIVCFDYAKTGDGGLTACLLLKAISSLKIPFEKIGSEFEEYPQYCKAIKVKNPDEVVKDQNLNTIIAKLREKLQGAGKLIVRASGTEPMVRVLVQSSSRVIAEEITQILVKELEERFGAS